MVNFLKARYQIYRDIAGNYRFRLRAQNNKIVAVGEAYRSKAGCINGVRAVKRYCDTETVDLTIGELDSIDKNFEVFQDKALNYRFRLRAPNNEIIAVSEAYETKQGCMIGIEAVRNSCNAEI